LLAALSLDEGTGRLLNLDPPFCVGFPFRFTVCNIWLIAQQLQNVDMMKSSQHVSVFPIPYDDLTIHRNGASEVDAMQQKLKHQSESSSAVRVEAIAHAWQQQAYRHSSIFPMPHRPTLQ
jgi:hypothetical protein